MEYPISIGINLAIYLYIEYYDSKNEYASHIYSLIHAIFSVSINLLYIFELINYSFLHYCLTITVGYAIVDTSIIIFRNDSHKNKVIEMLFHHLLLVIFILQGQRYPEYIWYVNIGLLMETSTIFLNICWLNRYNRSKLFWISSYCLITLFPFLRIFVLGYLVYNLYFVEKMIYLGIMGFALWILNIYWYFKLLKLFTGYRKKKDY